MYNKIMEICIENKKKIEKIEENKNLEENFNLHYPSDFIKEIKKKI